MKDSISAEEKLLRLIRKGKKKETALNHKAAPKKPVRDLSLKLSLRPAVIAVFTVSCVYLIFSFLYPWFGLKEIKLPAVNPQDIVETGPESKEGPRPYVDYLEGVGNRSIFTNAVGAQSAQPAVNAASAGLAKDINLVGVISGNSPQAIIEDKKAQRTYYVTRGQYIGELQVEDILDGKVVLSLNGQKFELYM